MKPYTITQYTDRHLAQYGYLILSKNEAAVVDPPRDIEAMLKTLEDAGATLKAIIETHPHADFVSGHLELHTLSGAPIYVSNLLGADYEFEPFDSGNSIAIGGITLHALNTPGHSPDSISILLRDEAGTEQVLFSGDTLFVGDVGRPDLRESAGNIQAKREELAGMMYETVQTVLKELPDHVVVYPAHGAGTLCGKALRDAPSSTIGEELMSNPAFKEMSKHEFVTMLTEGQPFIPQYFPFDVSVNKSGARALQESLSSIPNLTDVPANTLILDTRSAQHYNNGHVHGALHIAENGLRFETWLGTIIAPNERFVVVVEQEDAKERVLKRIAAIGYEQNVLGVYVGTIGETQSRPIDINEFTANTNSYTIVDVRQTNESQSDPVFANALNIPLHELRSRVSEIPQDKPIAVHCAGGYRSMVGESVIASHVSVPVLDIGEHIKTCRK